MVSRKDIAERLNVSVSVVSRALNNSGYVEESKKQKIIALARELGYNRNPAALENAGRTRQMIFFCKDLRNSFYIEMYDGMMEAAREHDYQIVISQDCEFDNARTAAADGLIFPSEGVTKDYLTRIGRNNYMPIVGASFGEGVQMPRHIPEVCCDLWKGVGTMMDYLREKGHKRIAFASPFNMEETSSRGIAWKSYMYPILGENWTRYFVSSSNEHFSEDAAYPGLIDPLYMSKLPTRRHVYLDEDYFGKGRMAAELFCRQRCDATAVVCFNDEFATGFYMRLRRLGCRIPQDVSVVGIDGTYIRKYTDIELTTLSIQPQLMGRRCAEVLLEQIRGGKARRVTEIPTKIIEGDTVRLL